MNLNKIISLAAIALSGCASQGNYSGYLPAQGKITYAYKARVISSGYKGPKYNIQFALPDGTIVNADEQSLVNEYKKDDTLTIYYNPVSPAVEVTDVVNR